MKKTKTLTEYINKTFLALLVVFMTIALFNVNPPKAYAVQLSDCDKTPSKAQCVKEYRACPKADSECRRNVIKKYIPDLCGTGKYTIKTKINFGCSAKVENPILDLSLALLRFLSIGVGVFAVASIVYAGIRYTTSEGNPEAAAAAKDRVQTTLIAFFLYLFIFALIQYLVPGGLFN